MFNLMKMKRAFNLNLVLFISWRPPYSLGCNAVRVVWMADDGSYSCGGGDDDDAEQREHTSARAGLDVDDLRRVVARISELGMVGRWKLRDPALNLESTRFQFLILKRISVLST